MPAQKTPNVPLMPLPTKHPALLLPAGPGQHCRGDSPSPPQPLGSLGSRDALKKVASKKHACRAAGLAQWWRGRERWRACSRVPALTEGSGPGRREGEGSSQHPQMPLPGSLCAQPALLLSLLPLPPFEVPTGGSHSLSGCPHTTGNLCHSCRLR